MLIRVTCFMQITSEVNFSRVPFKTSHFLLHCYSLTKKKKKNNEEGFSFREPLFTIGKSRELRLQPLRMTCCWKLFGCTLLASVQLAVSCHPIWVHLLSTCFPGTAVWLKNAASTPSQYQRRSLMAANI